MSISSGRVLVVDDEAYQRMIMGEAVSGLGYETLVVANAIEVLQQLRSGSFDVLITDMKMPGMDGLRLTEQALAIDPSLSVIMVTAHGTVETAVEAMKKGAEDYLLKPVEFSVLEMVLRRVFHKRALVKENRKLLTENDSLRRSIGIRYHISNTLGKSQNALDLQAQIQHYMKERCPLLILGEPGVGKNDIARMIHFNGPWASNDLIFCECASIPPELQEAHLFGEEDSENSGLSRPGLVEKAHLGTLVLAGVHRLGAKSQARLARVIAEGKSQRVGGKRFHQVDVRVIATSDKADLQQLSSADEFRVDLHDLFHENSICVAPLRERKEDIPILIAAATRQMAQELGRNISKVDPEVVERLSAYDFPGNMRELKIMVESAVSRCSDNVLRMQDFTPQQVSKN